MKRHRRGAGEITVTLYDSNDLEVEVVATYSAGSPAYFSRSFGNYLPGDDETVEILEFIAVDEGADVAEVEAQTGRIEEAVREAARDDYDGPDTMEEARGER